MSEEGPGIYKFPGRFVCQQDRLFAQSILRKADKMKKFPQSNLPVTLDSYNEAIKVRGVQVMEILRVENLTKIYGSGANQVVALDHVSLSVEKGEFVAIVGASGSGKSTLLHLIGGVDRPTGGKVYIDGKDIYEFDDDKLAIFRRRQVGLIYQFYNLIPILNVEENISLPLSLDNREVDEKKLADLIRTLGLEKRRKHLPNELSGGQQQRTSIGRAMITNPAIILADEPTGNLDSKSSEEIVELLRRSNRDYEQTIVMITHNMEIAKYADRIIKIEDGRIVGE